MTDPILPKDLYIAGVPPAEVRGSRFLTLQPESKNPGTRGVQKMVTRFIKCFMTPRGTDLSDKTYGSSLATAFLGNTDASRLRQLAVQSVAEVQKVMAEYDSSSNIENAARLGTVDIQNVSVDADARGVNITLLLKNSLGNGVQLTIPFPVGA